MAIRYLNTDLDVMGPHDLTALAAAFQTSGVVALHVTRGDNGTWRATFESARQFEEPEANIADLLSAVESLAEPSLSDWRACTLRECNIGYDCGREPWAFNQGLPARLLRRMADAGVALRITLYPEGAA